MSAQDQQLIAAGPNQAQRFAAGEGNAGVVAAGNAGVAATNFPSASAVSVQVCGRSVHIPADASGSLSLLSRYLASQLKISSHSSLQFQDVAGKHVKNDLDLAAALREGRQPLQASMTVLALREIEQRKSEVEAKKEELAQFQWQVIVDQIAALAQQVNSFAPKIDSVRSECLQVVDEARAELAARGERMEEALTREAQQREYGFRDMESKIDKLVEAICAERAARDVVSHQLNAQLDAVTVGVESDRSIRAQERAEMQRVYEAVKHQVDAEHARNEEQLHWHMESAKRLEARLEDHASADTAQQVRLTELEASADRLRASVASTESQLAMTQRTMQELMTQRQEELAKAVRDEMVGRENHMARFARELETSWQSLEARVQRIKEEAAMGTSTVSERARVLELRCAQMEHDLSTHVTAQTEQNHRISEKTSIMSSTVDRLDMNLKSNDVVTQTTVTRVDDIQERLRLVEDDCQSKAKADYWRPQMEALQRADMKFESRLATMEKDLVQRLQQEASNRESLKVNFQDSLKSCMDKVIGAKPREERSRFGDLATASPVSDDGCSGLLTPRCTFSMPSTAYASRAGSGAMAGTHIQSCAVIPMAHDKSASVISPARVLVRSPDASPQTGAQHALRLLSPRRA